MRLRALAAALLLVAAAVPARAGAANGSVIIRTTPSGAAIAADGAPQGEAPRTIDLPAGKHTITLSLPGHLAETHTVVVKEGPPAKLYVRLTKSGAAGLRVRDDQGGTPPPGLGTVTVTTDPPGLRVFVNGERVDRPTPVSFDIGPGTYATVIKYQETEVLSTSTVVKEGWKVELKRTLQKEVAAARRQGAQPGVDAPGDPDRPRDGRKGDTCKCTPRAKLKACVEKKRACKLGTHDGARGSAYALCYTCPQFRRVKKKQKGAAESACDTRTGRTDDCPCRDIARVVESCLAPQEKCLRRCGRD
jgi:hypothetical protein